MFFKSNVSQLATGYLMTNYISVWNEPLLAVFVPGDSQVRHTSDTHKWYSIVVR